MLCCKTAARSTDDVVRRSTQSSYPDQRGLVSARLTGPWSQQWILRKRADDHRSVKGSRPPEGTHGYELKLLVFSRCFSVQVFSTVVEYCTAWPVIYRQECYSALLPASLLFPQNSRNGQHGPKTLDGWMTNADHLLVHMESN